MRKGFTVIELLATIAIMAIGFPLSWLAFASQLEWMAKHPF